MTISLSGRCWAYAGASLGGATSVAANVAHSYIPPQEAPAGWTPPSGAVVGAVVWPVFLLVAVEILARVAWPHGLTWQAIRWAGMVPVAVVAALVSYRHLSGLLAYYGEEAIVCVLGPLAVDGLMVMATGAILATGHPRHTAPASAPADRTTVVRPAPTPPAVPAPHPATPAQAGNPLPTPSPEPAATPAPDPATPIPTPADVAARLTPAPASTPARPATPPRPANTGTGKPRPRMPAPTTTAEPLAAPAADTPVTAPEPAQPPPPMAADPGLLARADQVARQYRTEHGTPITPGQLAVRLKVTSEQAAQALAVLDLGPHSPTEKIPTVNGRPVKATR